ncbi:UPF0102 protein YraN [hydrothermal vent metagenome]|uniref:UPF0102 protein YraN n=1 Tax=hydrothermal vent metagenome TaxID=652676 RepID=A0A3B1BI54_9ZZZZ
MTAPGRRETGTKAEIIALAHLEQQGLRHVASNYRCRMGEIDLIMQDGTVLVFAEVRYRNSTNFGSAAESVTPAKQQRIINTANHYLQSRHKRKPPPCRFDMIAIVGKELQDIQWLQDAFQIGGKY